MVLLEIRQEEKNEINKDSKT